MTLQCEWRHNDNLNFTLFTLCIALAFCHCFSIVRCPCSHFNNSWLMEIWRLVTCGHGLQCSSVIDNWQLTVNVARAECNVFLVVRSFLVLGSWHTRNSASSFGSLVVDKKGWGQCGIFPGWDQWFEFFSESTPCGLRGVMHPWFICWFRHCIYIVCLFTLYVSPLILFFFTFSLLIFSFENRPTPFPVRRS